MSAKLKTQIHECAETAHVMFVAHNWRWAEQIPTVAQIEQKYLEMAKISRTKVKNGADSDYDAFGRLMVASCLIGTSVPSGKRIIMTDFGVECGYHFK